MNEDLPDINAGQTHRLKLMEVVSKTPSIANTDPRKRRHRARDKNTEQQKAGFNRYFKSASQKFDANLLKRAPDLRVKLPKSITQTPIVKKPPAPKSRSKGANTGKTIKAQ